MKHTKPAARYLAILLALLLALSSSAFAAPAADGQAAEDSDAGLFLSLSEKQTEALSFPLTEEQAAQVEAAGADQVTWTLHRTATYANPADGSFNPIHGEDTMYPNEQQEIDFSAINSGAAGWGGASFSMESFETSLNGTTLRLDFTTSPAVSRGNVSMPHSNGGAYLDVCGSFTLTADLNGTTLATLDNVVIKPYDTFHTMWEIYDELERLGGLGDNDASTPAPYVEYNVMGQSNAGYDMPYLIVAKDKAAVENWLDLADRAETNPAAVQEELASGSLDYQVPILYSNIHSNEVAAVDGVLEFTRMLIEQPAIDYTKLTGFTAEGQAVNQAQREAMGLHTPSLVADRTNYLGSIWPSDESQNSGKVENFDSYYTSEDATVTVDQLLDDVFFILVPEENVEGRMYDTRTSSGGFDLNRDNSFQTMAEAQNMQHLIATYDPVTHVELHGQVTGFQVEPCSPPHEPNIEYDLLSNHLMAGGEAFGAAAVANNPDYQSYVIPMRDYLESDDNGDPFWYAPWDDMSTSYTPQFAMLQGCVAYTVELPAYSESARQAATYGLVGLSDYVAAEKEGYFSDLVEVYARCAENRNTDAEVSPWLVDAHDATGAEADLFRPAFSGEGENGQFFPECYLIPLDSDNQKNLQAAYDMVEWLTRNDVKVGITSASVTVDGVTYPAGTAVVSMYQAKRAVANGALYDGTLICNWTDLYSEGITAFNYTRGFDMVTCAKPADYAVIAAAVGQTLDYDSVQAFLSANAKSQFSGQAKGDVIISNASEASTAAVNALLQAGKKVGLITEGEYKGDFICSYADWNTVSGQYVLTGTGVQNPDLTAYVIGGAPTVYLSGTANALTPASAGYIYTMLVASSYVYNYDRMAMKQMNFLTTEDPAEADAVVGASALDEGGLAAVQSGTPYVGYTSAAVRSVNQSLFPELAAESTDGMDCLGYVTYPEETLVNASYILDGDDVFYGYGTSYFTALPDGAKVLVQRDGSRDAMEGFLNGDEESRNAFLNGIQGFSYEGQDGSGNDVNVTLFANSLTNKIHQRDEYAFISNAIFAGLLSDEAYTPTPVRASVGGGGGGGGGFAAAYAVAKDTAVANGSVTVSASQASAGQKITVTVKADEGYVLDSVNVKNASGVEVALTDNGDGTFTFTMPSSAVTVSAAFNKQDEQPAAEPSAEPAESGSQGFTDVPAGAYFAPAVDWAVEKGVTTGTSGTTFSPDLACTRAQTVTFLWRAYGSPAPASQDNPFTDVAEDDYFYNAVLWGVEQGIVKGTSETTFSPDATVTRGQIVTMLHRDLG